MMMISAVQTRLSCRCSNKTCKWQSVTLTDTCHITDDMDDHKN